MGKVWRVVVMTDNCNSWNEMDRKSWMFYKELFRFQSFRIRSSICWCLRSLLKWENGLVVVCRYTILNLCVVTTNILQFPISLIAVIHTLYIALLWNTVPYTYACLEGNWTSWIEHRHLNSMDATCWQYYPLSAAHLNRSSWFCATCTCKSVSSIAQYTCTCKVLKQ